MRDRLRQLEHVPDRVDPRADADDDLVAADRRPPTVSTAVTRRAAAADCEARDLDAFDDLDAERRSPCVASPCIDAMLFA